MRGFWHMLEAIVAGLMIMLFLVTIVGRPIAQPGRDLTERAYEILEGLEKRGILRPGADANDYAAEEASINYHAAVSSVQICAFDGTCAGPPPTAKTRWRGTYVLAGANGYAPREVRLFLSNP